MGELSILNRSGHTAVTWDESKPETVEKARQTYQQFLAQGFATFVVSPNAPSTQVREFDPTAKRIIAVGPYVGGLTPVVQVAQLVAMGAIAFSVAMLVIAIANMVLLTREMQRDDVRRRALEETYRQRVEEYNARMVELDRRRQAQRELLRAAGVAAAEPLAAMRATTEAAAGPITNAYLRQQEAQRALERLERRIPVDQFRRQYLGGFTPQYETRYAEMMREGHANVDRLLQRQIEFNFEARFAGDWADPLQQRGPRPTESEWIKAHKRAYALFLEVISPGQRKQWDRYEYFAVIGSDGGIYRLAKGESQFLGMPKDGYPSRFCLQPIENYTPFFDKVIAWKAWIEADEETFLNTANRFPIEVPYSTALLNTRADLSNRLKYLARQLRDYENLALAERKQKVSEQVTFTGVDWGA